MKRSLFLALLLSLPSRSLFGAEPDPAQPLAAERLGMDEAKALAKAGNLDDLATRLAGLNRSKAGTVESRLETSQRLIQVAEQLAREADPQNVPALLGIALEQLAQVEKQASDPEDKAAAQTLAGFIHERYLADPASARKSYAAAASLAPGKANQAKEAAERLKRVDDNLKQKGAAGPN